MTVVGYFSGIWVLTVLVLFSISINKLPGYILPLLPAAAALLALRLEEAQDARWWLAACAGLLVAFPITAQVLPVAVLTGLTQASRPTFELIWLAAPGYRGGSVVAGIAGHGGWPGSSRWRPARRWESAI